MTQLTYNAQPDTGVPGDPAFANDQETKIETYSNVTTPIEFGRAVMKVTGTDFRAAYPNTLTPQVVGFTRRDLQRVEGLYPLNSAMAVMSFGQIWVNPETSVTADNPVYVRAFGKNQIQITVNGTVLAVPFNTSNTQTLTDLATAIAAVAGVGSAASDGVHTITVTGSVHGTNVTLATASVTGGASQALIVITVTQVGIADTERGRVRATADTDTQTGLATCFRMTQCRFLTSVATYPSNSLNLAILDIISPLNP
jgi:ABC-type cobalamin transport system permease subunit